jgi:hypothetical protein
MQSTDFGSVMAQKEWHICYWETSLSGFSPQKDNPGHNIDMYESKKGIVGNIDMYQSEKERGRTNSCN